MCYADYQKIIGSKVLFQTSIKISLVSNSLLVILLSRNFLKIELPIILNFGILKMISAFIIGTMQYS